MDERSQRVPVNIEDQMRESYMDYAMSVIIGRALPDARDGLKPVHRRILYAMFSEGLVHNHRYSKCAGVVGEVLKRYHPHGDSAVYDALVRLAQEWNRRYPLIGGQGPIREAYREGRGILTVRARATVETDEKTGRSSIIVTEIPYQVNKARLIGQIAELVRERKLDGIAGDGLRDESDRDGMRIVIELKRDAVAEVLLNQLYKHTALQESFGVNMLAIVEGRPKLLSLKDALQVFLKHRREVVVRRTVYDLRKAEERLHILAGLKIAIEHLDEAIGIIRAAVDPATARQRLMATFALSQLQAQAILDMRLQRLTGLERDKIVEEYAETEKAIVRYRAILADEREVAKIIADELRALREKYGDERRTRIVDEATAISVEDLIVEEDMVVTISHEGYIKRNAVALYRAQRRGGRGRIGAATREEDFVEHLFIASTHSYLLFFTTSGKVFWLKVHEIPQAGRAARGRSITNVLSLKPEEKLSAFLPVREFQEGRYVLFATRRGLVKKTDLMQYASPRPSGIIAIALEEGDEVIGVRLTDGSLEAILSTRDGQAIRFKEDEARPMGRDTYGVRGMKLDAGDEVVSLDLVEPGATLLAVSENGYGKRTEMEEYRLTRRGGKGIITMKTTDKTGRVIGVRMVTDDDQIMLVTSGGKVIRLRVNEIRVIGRNTQGVRLIGLEEGERVA